MSTINFSIVIPVYNVEPYLEECLDSILTQTYPHFEVIAVDDGSTDNSLKILNEYTKRDRRIQLINSANLGVSAARNKALDRVSGEYVLMVDSDDLLQKNALEILEQIVTKTKAEIISFDYRKIYKKEDVISESNETYTIKLITQLDFFRSIFDKSNKFTRYKGGYVWLRMIKTELLQKCRFNPSLRFYEDEDFLASLYISLPKSCLLYQTDANLYLYRKRPSSLMTSNRSIRLFTLYKFQRRLEKKFPKGSTENRLLNLNRLITLIRLMQLHLSENLGGGYNLFRKIILNRYKELPIKLILPFVFGRKVATCYCARRLRKSGGKRHFGKSNF